MTDKKFHTVRVSKGNGQYREIYVPCDSFKAELKSYLPLLVEISSRADEENVCHAFMKGRNCVTNAMHHIGYKYTLSFDIKDFFDSITRRHLDGKVPKHLLLRCLIDNSPRQGFPTSPSLSNIALSSFDRDLKSSLSTLTPAYSYTRYADDLTVSFDDGKLISRIRFIVQNLLSQYGFELSKKKSKLQLSSNGRVIITGVGVDKNGVHPTRATRKKIRAAIHQRNKKSVIGLKEWEKCKLPTSERRMIRPPERYTPVRLKQTNCRWCGEGQLVWGSSKYGKLKLFNVHDKTPHNCTKADDFITQEKLANSLLDMGYQFVRTASKTWRYSLAFFRSEDAHIVLFRTHGIDTSIRSKNRLSYDDEGQFWVSGHNERLERHDYSRTQGNIHNEILKESEYFVSVYNLKFPSTNLEAPLPNTDFEQSLFSYYCDRSGGLLPLLDSQNTDPEDGFF